MRVSCIRYMKHLLHNTSTSSQCGSYGLVLGGAHLRETTCSHPVNIFAGFSCPNFSDYSCHEDATLFFLGYFMHMASSAWYCENNFFKDSASTWNINFCPVFLCQEQISGTDNFLFTFYPLRLILAPTYSSKTSVTVQYVLGTLHVIAHIQ